METVNEKDIRRSTGPGFDYYRVSPRMMKKIADAVLAARRQGTLADYYTLWEVNAMLDEVLKALEGAVELS